MITRLIKKCKNISLRSKFSIFYSIILCFILITTLFITFNLCYNKLCDNIDISLRNIAIMISDNDNILKSVETDQVSESVNQYCDNVLANMQNIDIITICNSQGTRLYHRDKEKIGEHIVGNDEGLMLSTHQNYFNTATGTLGIQRRYFHALFDDNNKFIGFICVSVLVKNLEIIKDHLLLAYWMYWLNTSFSNRITIKFQS